MHGSATTRPFGPRGMRLPPFGFGTATIGGLHGPVSAAVAHGTLAKALEAGFRYFDTAPLYGVGLGEQRLGEALADWPRLAITLSTKVGWRVVDGILRLDYSAAGVMRSIDDSLARLRTDHIDIALVHDIDPYNHGVAFPRRLWQVLDEALPALAALRDQGVVRAIGVGINSPRVCATIAARADIDGVLIAGRYTLLDQAAAEFLPLATERGLGVIAGAPFNSGVLARRGGGFFHRPPPAEVAARVEALTAIAARHGVTLTAAALQFALRHPQISAVLPGARSVGQVADLGAAVDDVIPDAFWNEIDALLPGASAAARDVTKEELA